MSKDSRKNVKKRKLTSSIKNTVDRQYFCKKVKTKDGIKTKCTKRRSSF